jgi:hypothetical protein
MAINILDIPRTTLSGSQARLYSIYTILRMSDGHKSQSGSAYTHHCLRSSRVRLIRSRGALPASLNGCQMETRRDRRRYTATRTSAVDHSAETRQTDVQMTTI